MVQRTADRRTSALSHMLSGDCSNVSNFQLLKNMSVLENVMVGCHRRMRATLLEVMLGLKRVSKEHKETRERAIQEIQQNEQVITAYLGKNGE